MKAILRALLVAVALAIAAPAAVGQGQGITTSNGLWGLGGLTYSHVIVAIGYQSNPLSGPSQVGGYSAIYCNTYAITHCAGFETGIGLDPGVHTEDINSYTTSGVAMGAGSSATRYRVFAFSSDGPAANNAVLANANDHFTGNWFINYKLGRPSRIDGDVGLGHDPVSVPNSRVLSLNAAQYDFVRFYIGNPGSEIEKGRVTVSATDMYVDNFGTGAITIRANGNTAIVINADGTVRIPSLAGGSAGRSVKADVNGLLSAP